MNNMSYTVIPIEALGQATKMPQSSILRLKESGIENIDLLYARIMTVGYNEREHEMKALERLIGLKEGHLFSFAEMLERKLVSRKTLDEYEAKGISFGALEKELKWLDLEEDYKLTDGD